MVLPFNLLNLENYSWLKLITYEDEQGSSFARDLTTLKECKLPDDFSRIYHYKDGILTFEIAREQYRFYSFEKQEYINPYTYQRITDMVFKNFVLCKRGQSYSKMVFKNSFVLCKRGQTYILLAIDGTEYPINVKGALSQYGETVIGVNLIEEKSIGQDGFEHRKIKYEVSVFKKNILLSKFVYNKAPFDETFDLVSEDTILVTIWLDHVDYVEMRINLKGESVSCPETGVSEISKTSKDENTRLIKMVKEKYLNSICISDIDSCLENERNYFDVKVFKDLAYVSFYRNEGDYVEPCRIGIGYADEDMCYWSRDCLKYLGRKSIRLYDLFRT